MRSEKKDIISAFIFPSIFVAVLWIIFYISKHISYDLALLGIRPLDVKGLIGVICAPLIHLNFDHIFNNSTSLLVLGFGLFFLYERKAYSIFFFIYLVSGFWGWFFARGGYHIGASGIIYGLFFFLIVSAFLKREKKTIAFSLIISFLYGALVWGFFPIFFPNVNISWEIHLTGAVAGVTAAFYYKKEGPQKPQSPFEDEEEDTDDENPYWMNTNNLNP